MPVKDGGGGKRRKKSKANEVAEVAEEQAQANADNSNVDLDVSLSREEDFDAAAELPPGALRYKHIYIAPPPPSTCSFDNKGPRLVLKSIVVKNFKSFYGEHTIGPLFKGMSAVIGPNGSGKSNVLDSILFVFGYRASKIRTKKVSMLIHSSTHHTDLNSCTVTVNFTQIIDKGQNEDPEELPNTEVVVSRTACRDNTSYYTLDGRRVQFKDVATRLRGFGIDLTNGRFLILQGEVEQIAQMKPKGETEHDIGLLEFLEDIIGTLRYREPLEKAVAVDNDLEALRETQAEKTAVAERHLRSLEEGKNAAVEYLEKENELVRLKHKVLQKQMYDNRAAKVTLVEEKQEKSKTLEGVETEEKTMAAKMEDFTKALKEKKSVIDKENRASEKLDAEYKKLSNRDAELRETLKANTTRRKKIKEALKTEENKLVELRALPEKNTGEIAELEKMISRNEKDRTTARDTLTQALEKVERDSVEPNKKLAGLEAELVTLAKSRDEKAATHHINQSKLGLCTKQEKEQQEKLETLTKNLSEAKDSVKDKAKRLTVLEKTELPQTKQQLAEAREQLETERGERARVDQRAAKLHQELEGARVAAESLKHRNRVVAGLMQQCAAGNIPGVFGRLGDLGGIEPTYDVAISSSCGTLEYIVVDKMDTAEKCIQYMKDTNLGRANFIALEKMRHWEAQCRQKMTTPENVPRLFDLVKVEDERVLPAFYFALRNTLVAKDIDQAVRIGLNGRERHRVVDLKGNIVEPGGTVTGGGAPIRGRMGTKVTAGLPQKATASADTPQLQQSLEQLKKRSATLMENIIKMEQKERELRNKLPQFEAEAKRLNMDVQHLQQSVPKLEKQLEDQREVVSRTSSDQKEVKRLQKEVENSTKELEQASAAAGKLETQANQLRTHLEEIRLKHVGSLENKVKDLTKKINKAQADKTKLAAAIASCERNIQKSEEKIADNQQEMTGIEAEMIKTKEELDELGEKAKELIAQKEATGEKIIELEGEYNELKDQNKGFQTEMQGIKSRRLDLEAAIEKLSTDIKRIEAQHAAELSKLNAMKLEEVPNDKVVQPLKLYNDEELADINGDDLDYAIGQLVDHRGPKPNLGIIDEYRAKEKQFIELAKLLEAATEKRNEVKTFLHDARNQRYAEFTKGFQVINNKLKEVFRMISMGGDAELELQDSFNPFLEGIAFSVRPRNKAWTQIDRLSGGEKTLSSLALIFGLHYYKPSPFYMMDEIDAALDARNVSIIGHYIKQFTINCQFIVISLRPEMYDLFERRVIGIFKPDGCSRTVAIDPTAFQGAEEDEAADEPSMVESVDMSLNESVASLPETPAQRPVRQRNPVQQPVQDESLDDSVASLPETPAQRPIRQRNPVQQPVQDDSLSSLSGPDTDTEVPKQPSGHASDSESSSLERPSPKKQRLGTVPPSDEED